MPIKRPRYLAEAKKEMNFFVLRPTCRNFAPHFQESSTFPPKMRHNHPSVQFHPDLVAYAIWTRSSMDRIKDSGSFDWGSTPHGFTIISFIYIVKV